MPDHGAEPDLRWLLDYELRQSERYRHFASLVMFSAEDAPIDLDALLGDVVRDSDVLFVLDDVRAVVMGQTGGAEACKALKRYKKTINGKIPVRYAVSSYPKDGLSAENIMQVARRRLDQAKMLETGSVVAEG